MQPNAEKTMFRYKFVLTSCERTITASYLNIPLIRNTIGNTDRAKTVLRVQRPFRYGVVFKLFFLILQSLNFKILCVARPLITTPFDLPDGNGNDTVCL